MKFSIILRSCGIASSATFFKPIVGSCPPRVLRLDISEKFTPELTQFRRECMSSEEEIKVFDQPFDNKKSTHILLRREDDGKIMAYARNTLAEDGFFHSLTGGADGFHYGKDAIDTNRHVIHPMFRGNGLFELLSIVSIAHAYRYGFKFCNAAYAVDNKYSSGDRLLKMGLWEKRGLPTKEKFLSTHVLQPIVCDIDKTSEKLPFMLERRAAIVKEKGYQLHKEFEELLDHPVIDTLSLG